VTATTKQAFSPSATVRTISQQQTRDFGAALAAVARPGDRIALLGPLGAGKTQFAKGFATGLGVTEIVNSPSFTLMAEYAGRLPLFHQDLYRLSDAEEVIAGGLVDDRQEDGVTLIEWGERLPDRLDARRVAVRFEVGNEDERTITVSATHPSQVRYVRVASSWSAE
jgi:tRNA threonylcarbamoyladenosine biosynthesis protein TsaE